MISVRVYIQKPEDENATLRRLNVFEAAAGASAFRVERRNCI
jgi:hypothetical protein